MQSDVSLGEKKSEFQKLLGFELTEWAPDHAVIELPLARHLLNRQDIPHGGVHATLLDTAMGYAGCYTGDAQNPALALTLSLTASYVSVPGPEATRLIATGQRTGGGKSSFFARAELRDDTGKLIAEGTGVFRARQPRKAAP